MSRTPNSASRASRSAGTFELGGENQWHDWRDVPLGEEITVEAGTYDFTCTLNGQPNVDGFLFVVTEIA